jgi:hypothetical protein
MSSTSPIKSTLLLASLLTLLAGCGDSALPTGSTGCLDGTCEDTALPPDAGDESTIDADAQNDATPASDADGADTGADALDTSDALPRPTDDDALDSFDDGGSETGSLDDTSDETTDTGTIDAIDEGRFAALALDVLLEDEHEGESDARPNGWIEADERISLRVSIRNPSEMRVSRMNVDVRTEGLTSTEWVPAQDSRWSLAPGEGLLLGTLTGTVLPDVASIVVALGSEDDALRAEGSVRTFDFVRGDAIVRAGEDGLFRAGETGSVEFPWTHPAGPLPPTPSTLEPARTVPPILEFSIEGETVPGTLVAVPIRVPLPIAAGSAIRPSPTAALRIANDAADGEPICLIATARLRDAERVLVERSSRWCTTLGFGDEEFCIDEDEDGFGIGTACAGPDCDDTRADVYPGAEEVCDGVDNDCDGLIDEGLVAVWYRDEDGDTWGDDATAETFCGPAPDGWVMRGGDCDDTRDDVYPGAIELCDGVDNNCNGMIDENSTTIWYRDDDGDTWGNSAISQAFCNELTPDGWARRGGDCDDTRSDVNPDAVEVCDGVDNDCDGRIDNVSQIIYPDVDGDGFGDRNRPVAGCPPADDTAWLTRGGDCDDNNAAVNPDAVELCDGVDNNCNGRIDEGFDFTSDIRHCGGCDQRCPVGLYECSFGVCEGYCLDQDGDGFWGPGNCATPNQDCNDNDSSIFPGAPEICGDGIDQNCDGRDAVCPTPCDPAIAGQCPVGARCALSPTGTRFECRENGTVARGGVCLGEGILDDCTGGNLCVPWNLDPTPTCHQICTLPGSTDGSDTRCSDPEEICGVRLVDGAERVITRFCSSARTCDPTALPACTSGEACLAYRDPRLARDTFRCLAPPPVLLPIGANCTAPDAFCSEGTTCVGSEGAFFCRRICRTGTSCPGGGACNPISSPTWPTAYGFCL